MNEITMNPECMYQNVQAIQELVRVAIQNFSKNPVKSTVCRDAEQHLS